MPCLSFDRFLAGALLALLLTTAPVATYSQSEPPAEATFQAENPRLVAAALCLALGPFGVHRMYLGTDVRVPVFYTLTLGGGLGVLPVLDLCVLLFSKNPERFYNHSGVFLWTAKKQNAGPEIPSVTGAP